MKRFPYFNAIFLSLFSRELYRDVALNWRGIGLLYSLIISVIYTLIIFAMVPFSGGKDSDISIKKEVYFIADQVPEITIKNNIATTKLPGEYKLKDHNGALIAVINTDDTDKTYTLSKNGPYLVLLRDKILTYSNNRIEQREYPKETYVIDRDLAYHFIKMFSRPVILIAIGLFIMGFFILSIFTFRLIFNVVISILGIIIAKIMKANLDYEAIFRLCFVASTPLAILSLIPHLYLGFWVNFLILIFYLSFAIRSSKISTPTDGENHVTS